MSTLKEKALKVLDEKNKLNPNLIAKGNTIFGITGLLENLQFVHHYDTKQQMLDDSENRAAWQDYGVIGDEWSINGIYFFIGDDTWVQLGWNAEKDNYHNDCTIFYKEDALNNCNLYVNIDAESQYRNTVQDITLNFGGYYNIKANEEDENWTTKGIKYISPLFDSSIYLGPADSNMTVVIKGKTIKQVEDLIKNIDFEIKDLIESDIITIKQGEDELDFTITRIDGLSDTDKQYGLGFTLKATRNLWREGGHNWCGIYIPTLRNGDNVFLWDQTKPSEWDSEHWIGNSYFTSELYSYNEFLSILQNDLQIRELHNYRETTTFELSEGVTAQLGGAEKDIMDYRQQISVAFKATKPVKIQFTLNKDGFIEGTSHYSWNDWIFQIPRNSQIGIHINNISLNEVIEFIPTITNITELPEYVINTQIETDNENNKLDLSYVYSSEDEDVLQAISLDFTNNSDKPIKLNSYSDPLDPEDWEQIHHIDIFETNILPGDSASFIFINCSLNILNTYLSSDNIAVVNENVNYYKSFEFLKSQDGWPYVNIGVYADNWNKDIEQENIQLNVVNHYDDKHVNITLSDGTTYYLYGEMESMDDPSKPNSYRKTYNNVTPASIVEMCENATVEFVE